MTATTNNRLQKIEKYAAEFEAYSERAQGMQLMLAMCLKAGLPMPSQTILDEMTSNKKSTHKGA